MRKSTKKITKKMIQHYKDPEAQEIMNASLGDPSLTEAKRGQMETQVIKKICVHKWDEKKQTYNEVRLLSILVNRQNIIPRINERMWLADDKFNVQYEVDDISYYYSEKEFTIDIYVKEV